MFARIGLSIVLLVAVAIPATAQAKTRVCGTTKFAGVTYTVQSESFGRWGAGKTPPDCGKAKRVLAQAAAGSDTVGSYSCHRQRRVLECTSGASGGYKLRGSRRYPAKR